MDSPNHDTKHISELKADTPGARLALEETSWLSEIADQLESNPEECGQAFEALETLDPDLRLSVIEELSGLGHKPGARMLLDYLRSASDLAMRSAAIAALERVAFEDRQLVGPSPAASPIKERQTGSGLGEIDLGPSIPMQGLAQRIVPGLARSLVTPIDGDGRASIVVSVNHGNERRTAAFLCDVRRGIRDVVGELEPESPLAGNLMDALEPQPGIGCVRDVPELALGLLSGSLMLSDESILPAVRHWLLATVGDGFQPKAFPATIPGLETASLRQAEMPERAAAVLKACPSWLDNSPLTFELAEEIWLREGRATADPERDAGAYRFLFEHRLIHNLELYQRMLLWMAWFWRFRDEIELSRSALALACQLLDEQFAVPSHPFTVALTTRSFQAAQRQRRQGATPCTDRGA